MNLGTSLGEENTAGVELVTAKFGHQASTGLAKQPPVNQLIERIEPPLLVEVLELSRIFGGDLLDPAVRTGEAVVAMPTSADELDVTQQPLGDQIIGIGIQHAVMPLVSNGEHLAGLTRDADHLLALLNAVRHQLFAQHVLARLHGVDGNHAVGVQGSRDHDRFNLGMLLQQLLVAAVDLDFTGGGLPQLLVQTNPMLVAVAREGPLLVRWPEIGDRDDVEVLGGMLGQQH